MGKYIIEGSLYIGGRWELWDLFKQTLIPANLETEL